MAQKVSQSFYKCGPLSYVWHIAGFNFWKVSARKFYAIPDDDLRPADARGVKRSRTAAAVLTSHSDNDVLCAISHDVAAIHEN